MFEELGRSLTLYINEKIKSPLAGGFVLAWLVINHKVVMLIFSATAIQTKYYIISQTLYPDGFEKYAYLFVYPLLSSITFLLVYPYPSRWAYMYSTYQQNKNSKVQEEYEKDARLTVEQSRKLRQQILDIQNEYYEKLDRNELEVKALNDELKGLRNSAEEKRKPTNNPAPSVQAKGTVKKESTMNKVPLPLRDPPAKPKLKPRASATEPLTNTLNEIELKVLGILANNGGSIDLARLHSKLTSLDPKFPKHTTEGKLRFYLEGLEKKGLVTNTSSTYWLCTPKGRSILFS